MKASVDPAPSIHPPGAGQVPVGPVRRGGGPLHAELDRRERGRPVRRRGGADTQVRSGTPADSLLGAVGQGVSDEHANRRLSLFSTGADERVAGGGSEVRGTHRHCPPGDRKTTQAPSITLGRGGAETETRHC